MNRRTILFLIVLIGIAVAVFANKNLRDRILPDGKVSVDDSQDLSDVDLNVTPAPIQGTPEVIVETSKGRFVVQLRPDVAPKTVTNFLTKWNNGYCDNKTFHRVEDWVVQGCDPSGDGTGGQSNLPTETSQESFTTGSLGVARRPSPREVSNDSQFFIVKRDSTFLNGEYTYFGKVTSGMDIVNSLQAGDKIISTSVLTK